MQFASIPKKRAQTKKVGKLFYAAGRRAAICAWRRYSQYRSKVLLIMGYRISRICWAPVTREKNTGLFCSFSDDGISSLYWPCFVRRRGIRYLIVDRAVAVCIVIPDCYDRHLCQINNEREGIWSMYPRSGFE
jgi:hypothetical protein